MSNPQQQSGSQHNQGTSKEKEGPGQHQQHQPGQEKSGQQGGQQGQQPQRGQDGQERNK
jgi:hypothetical protein